MVSVEVEAFLNPCLLVFICGSPGLTRSRSANFADPRHRRAIFGKTLGKRKDFKTEANTTGF
jgi:hypothetical protein